MGEIINQKYLCIALVAMFILMLTFNFVYAENMIPEKIKPFPEIFDSEKHIIVKFETKQSGTLEVEYHIYDRPQYVDKSNGITNNIKSYYKWTDNTGWKTYNTVGNRDFESADTNVIYSKYDIYYNDKSVFFSVPVTLEQIIQQEVGKVPGTIQSQASPIIIISGIILGIGLVVSLIVRWVYLFAQ